MASRESSNTPSRFILWKPEIRRRLDLVSWFESKLYYINPFSSRMIPYGCLSTGSSIGMIEVVHDAETIAKLQKTKGVTATFAKNCIWDWLREYHVTDDRCVLQCLD